MFKFTDDERARFADTRSISRDADGNEVLVGLDAAETALYMAHTRAFRTQNRDRDRKNRDVYLALHEKHERARLDVIGSEHYVRTENPPRH